MLQRSLGVVLVFFSCLHTPGLRTTLTVPIISRNYRIVDMLAGDWLRVRPDSLLELHFVARTESVLVNDLIDTLHIADTLKLTGEHIVVTPVAGDTWTVPAGQVFGVVVGETLVVPAFSYESTFVSHVPGIEGAVLAGGVLSLLIENRLPVGLEHVELAVAGLGTVFSGPVDSVAYRRVNLSGLVLDSLVLCSLRLAGPGSHGEPVAVELGDELVIGLVVDSLRVRHGRIRLQDSSQVSGATTSVSYLRTRYRVRVDTGLFATGQLCFGLENELPLGFHATVRLVEFNYVERQELETGDAVEYRLDLAGIGYRSSCPDSSQLTFICSLERQSPPGVLQFDSTRGLVVGFVGGAVALEYLAGEVLDTVWTPEWVETLAVRFPDWARRVRVRRLVLHGTVVSAIGFCGLLELQATGLNAAGESLSAALAVTVPGGTPATPDSTGFAVDLAGVVNLGPDRIVLRGRAGFIGSGVLVRESYAAIRPEATFPLQAKLLADTIELGPWTVPIDSIIRRQMPKVSGARISAHVVNHLPVAVTGELSLWRDSVPDTIRLGLGVPMPVVEPGSGIVIQARDSTIGIELDSLGAKVFDTDELRAAIRLFLPETDTISLTARDYFQIAESHGELAINIRPR